MVEKPQVSNETLDKVLTMFVQRLGKRMDEHGRGKFRNPHEALGVLTEEFCEVGLANRGTDWNEIAEENFDVAVAAVWAVASMMTADVETTADNTNTSTPEETAQNILQEAKNTAYEAMQERAGKSGLVIASTLDEIK